MRILMITQDFPPQVGGIQTYSLELAARFAARCDGFAVVAPRDPGWDRIDSALPYAVHRLPGGSDGMRWTTVGALPWLARKERYDIAFHCQWYTAHAGLLLRSMSRVRKVFVAAHGRELLLNVPGQHSQLGGDAFDAARRAIVRRVDRWVPVSTYTAALLRAEGADPDRITVVPNGVDPDRRRFEDPCAWRQQHGLSGGRLLLTLGRLVPRKGVDTVLQALPDIARAIPDVHYVVAGDGPDRGRLEAMARELGQQRRVTFVGRVPEESLNACLSAAKVFVMPARSEPPDVEGFGLVFLEANACGRPVVGAADGGVVDAIEPGKTGELVPPGDPDALAKTVISLLQDEERAETMGRTGRQRVERQRTWDHVADRLLSAMQEVC